MIGDLRQLTDEQLKGRRDAMLEKVEHGDTKSPSPVETSDFRGEMDELAEIEAEMLRRGLELKK